MLHPKSIKYYSTYQMDAPMKGVKVDGMNMSGVRQKFTKNLITHKDHSIDFFKQINWLVSTWMTRFLDGGNKVIVC